MDTTSVSQAATAHPEAAAASVLVLGLVLAMLARWSMTRLARSANRLAGSAAATVMPALTGAVPRFAFWAVLIIAVFVALRLLGIGELESWLDRVLALVPQLLVGFAIIGVGHLGGVALGDVLRRLAITRDLPILTPRLTYVAVMGIAVVTGFEQMGINVSFIAQLMLITFTVALAALGLAFAFGARTHVSNLIAGAELGHYSAGDRLRIDEDEGTVVQVGRTALVLATDEGLVSIPASRFSTARIVRLETDGVAH